MSAAETTVVQVLVDAGKATPGGALAPQLGPTGVNLKQVVDDINKATQGFLGMKVPVKITVNKKKRTYEIEVGIPPASALILNEVGLEKGSGEPNRKKVGDITIEQAFKVAKIKRTDLLAKNMTNAALEILGTAHSLGLLCEGEDIPTVIQKIKNGELDDKVKPLAEKYGKEE